MKKLLWVSLLSLGLSGCMDTCDESCYVTDDNGYVHKTTHYLNDKRGQDYFPLKAPATGKNNLFLIQKRLRGLLMIQMVIV